VKTLYKETQVCGQKMDMDSLCMLFGKSRQAYYQYKKRDVNRLDDKVEIINAVRSIRSEAPHTGCYKLYVMLCGIFSRKRMPGRDRFFNLLRRKHLMLKRHASHSTTNSNHRYHKYKNLIKGFEPTSANQLWVADITYIPLVDGVCYLHLVTDAYSHKIVGWCLASGLHAIYTEAALTMAIKATGKALLSNLIHHSDRGSQYCCDAYVKVLKDHDISISMTEDYKPTDNAIAERVNGILKTEWLYCKQIPQTIEEARIEIHKNIEFYNTRRPHMSIGMRTPEQAHLLKGKLNKMWKKKIYHKYNEEKENYV